MSTHSSTLTVVDGAYSLLFAAALVGVLLAAGLDQGALTGGTPLLHEVFHDARHLLGLPCH